MRLMKLTMLAVCLCGFWVLMAAGCKKAEQAPPPGTMNMFGVNVELPRLEQEFQSAGPELQTAIQEIKIQCRTWQLPKMVVSLDKLSNTPNLTDNQKKAINDVMDQVKQVMAKQQVPMNPK